jgi:hypothetical protein
MPKPTDRNAPNDRNKNDRRAARKPGMGMYIPILLAAVIVCGIGLAMITDQQKKEEKPVAAAAPKKDPFADVPAEAPPQRAGGGGGSQYTFVSQAPDGLANDENWKAALVIGAEGERLCDEAKKAHAANDRALLNDKGRQAREKLTTAVEMTAAWEEELLEKYGDGNLQVREIMAIRSRWIGGQRWLHKTAAL